MVTNWQMEVLESVAKEYEANGKFAAGGILRMIAAKLKAADKIVARLDNLSDASSPSELSAIMIARDEYGRLSDRTTIYG